MNPHLYLRFVRAAITALLVCGVVLLIAPVSESAREGRRVLSDRDAEIERKNLEFMRNIPRFSVVPRPVGLSPLGDFEPGLPSVERRRGLVRTTLAWVDVAQPDAILNRVPSELRGVAKGRIEVKGKGRARANAATIVKLDQEAVKRLGYGGVEASIRAAGGRVLTAMPYGAIVVEPGSEASVREIAALSFVTAMTEYEPAFKISRGVGRIAISNRVRAESREMELNIQLWPRSDRARALQGIEKVVGNDGLLEKSHDGRSFRVKAGTRSVRALAHLDEVMSITESLDWVLMNAAVPTITMVGNFRDSPRGIRPYHDLGVDGGGIDTNADGQRINDGTDAVPPQIVAVTDNGISLRVKRCS